MVWSNEQRAFSVETYFSQSHSIVAVQRAFSTRYQIPPRDRVPDRKSILLWVENFKERGSVSEKRWGRPRTSRTPENIEAVRRSVLQSRRRSARKHHANNGHHLQDILFKTIWFKTSYVVISESKNKIFVSLIVYLFFTLKCREVTLPHPVYSLAANKLYCWRLWITSCSPEWNTGFGIFTLRITFMWKQ